MQAVIDHVNRAEQLRAQGQLTDALTVAVTVRQTRDAWLAYLEQRLEAAEQQDVADAWLEWSFAADLSVRSKLLREMRPGTRVVSLRLDMGNWEAERTERVGDPPRTIYRWTIPESPPVR